jgi:hypothetical protein
MPRSARDANHRAAAGLGSTVVFAAALALILTTPVHAQNRPPLLEPTALEVTMKQFYKAANVVIVTTKDGVEHAYRFTKDLIVHGGKKPGVDALEGLREGTTVVIHRTAIESERTVQEIDVIGGEGLQVAEGVVTHIDRRKQEITIGYADGRTEAMQMTNRAIAESEAGIERAGNETRIVVYYLDEAGHKVVHYFRKAS